MSATANKGGHHLVPTPLRVATTAAIIVNLGVVAWHYCDGEHEAIQTAAENVILTFFIVETTIKIKLLGPKRFFGDKWNCFDAAVIILSALPILAEGLAALRVVRVARVLHLLRHASHLRLLDLVRSAFTR